MSIVRVSFNVAISVVMPCRQTGHDGLAGSSDMPQLLRVFESESAVTTLSLSSMLPGTVRTLSLTCSHNLCRVRKLNADTGDDGYTQPPNAAVE
jgi:hypothetical protein